MNAQDAVIETLVAMRIRATPDSIRRAITAGVDLDRGAGATFLGPLLGGLRQPVYARASLHRECLGASLSHGIGVEVP